jgi:hypothetical protein
MAVIKLCNSLIQGVSSWFEIKATTLLTNTGMSASNHAKNVVYKAGQIQRVLLKI